MSQDRQRKLDYNPIQNQGIAFQALGSALRELTALNLKEAEWILYYAGCIPGSVRQFGQPGFNARFEDVSGVKVEVQGEPGRRILVNLDPGISDDDRAYAVAIAKIRAANLETFGIRPSRFFGREQATDQGQEPQTLTPADITSPPAANPETAVTLEDEETTPQDEILDLLSGILEGTNVSDMIDRLVEFLGESPEGIEEVSGPNRTFLLGYTTDSGLQIEIKWIRGVIRDGEFNSETEVVFSVRNVQGDLRQIVTFYSPSGDSVDVDGLVTKELSYGDYRTLNNALRDTVFG